MDELHIRSSVVLAYWSSSRDTSVPMTSAAVAALANRTGVCCPGHPLLRASVVLRQIAAGLPTNEMADGLVDQELSRAYATVPTRKLGR